MPNTLIVLTGLLLAPAGTGSVAPPPQQVAEPTNATIEMDKERKLYLRYDAAPQRTLSAYPGEPAYRVYLDLVGSIEPGERKRVPFQGPDYERLQDGSYDLFVWTPATPSGFSEPATAHIGPENPYYRCYPMVLPARTGSGNHTMTQGQYLALDKCYADSSRKAPAP